MATSTRNDTYIWLAGIGVVGYLLYKSGILQNIGTTVGNVGAGLGNAVIGTAQGVNYATQGLGYGLGEFGLSAGMASADIENTLRGFSNALNQITTSTGGLISGAENAVSSDITTANNALRQNIQNIGTVTTSITGGFSDIASSIRGGVNTVLSIPSSAFNFIAQIPQNVAQLATVGAITTQMASNIVTNRSISGNGSIRTYTQGGQTFSGTPNKTNPLTQQNLAYYYFGGGGGGGR